MTLGLLDKEIAAFPALVMEEARRLRRGSGTGDSGSSPLDEEDSSGFIFGTPSGSCERLGSTKREGTRVASAMGGERWAGYFGAGADQHRIPSFWEDSFVHLAENKIPLRAR